MALSDISFKLFTDSGLTTPVAALAQLAHKTDLSDGDQDFQYFLGSNSIGLKIEATSNPGVDNILITPTNLRDIWTATTAFVLGDSIEPTTPNTRRYECTTAGTTAASEPTFPTGGLGSTVADGSVVWTLVSLVHETTELKIATLQGGLSGATQGAALSAGTQVLSESANAFEFWVRVTNAVTTVESTIGKAGIGINTNSITEAVQ